VKPTHAIRIVTFTLSDTRTPETDEGGKLLGDLLRAAGFEVRSQGILREDPERLRAAITEQCASDQIDVIITTGGTGIAPRDRTIEAITPLFEKTIDGFGEAFRRLSWEDVGPNAILSRATAGVIGDKLVFALPGSVKALRLAVEQLIAPTLDHAAALVASRATHHHAPKPAQGS
jgi:molybdopterin adenylyltransferase